ncbi:class I SAM-dependent methyltransferase [Salmonella enterica subsp. enterica serovar Bovismorbificans]|nr:class I SAM-dependent methyltransferase [Salmonella enterica subsp. enterica serovar Bovismorbificans]
MNLQLTFDEDACNYDRWRPLYTAELFNDIIRYASVDRAKHALEIGIGTGQATQPILTTGCHVTAIDAGENLTNYTGKKFSSFPHFNIQHVTFENFDANNNSYDLIFSATAFHWIAEDTGLEKIYRLLKPGGVVALFWNHPFVNREDNVLHRRLQALYRQYRPESKVPVEFSRADLHHYKDAMVRYGFCDISARLYPAVRVLKAEEYIRLLNTYSDHRALDNEIRMKFEEAISSTITRTGGEVTVYDTMDLYLARKPVRK